MRELRSGLWHWEAPHPQWRPTEPWSNTAQYLMETYGLTAEQAGDVSPDVVWLPREQKGEARPYSSGDRLPFGADVFP